MAAPSQWHALHAECEERLAVLETARAAELARPLEERRVSYLAFLDRERAVYAFGLALLARLRPEATAGTVEVRPDRATRAGKEAM